MVAESRRADPSVERMLFEAAPRFGFFQAVRLLKRLYPHRSPVGHDAAPAAEVVRFRSHTSLSFPPSAIREITPATDESGQPQMSVAFMGLTGPLAVLPRHYTEILLESVRKKEKGLQDFFDLFNHRVLSLFYRAWEKYRFPIIYEEAVARESSEDRFSRYLFDFFGMGTSGLQGRLAVADKVLLFYAGLLSQRRRSASALTGLLRDYFQVPVKIAQFVGQWLTIPPANRTRLGVRDGNHLLGTSVVAGSQYWDQQASFRVKIGPLTFADYCEFLPSGNAFRPLVQLTRFVVGQQYDFGVQLVLEAAEVPRCELGKTGAGAPRLGWSAWLKTKEFTADAGDAVFAGALTSFGALPQ